MRVQQATKQAGLRNWIRRVWCFFHYIVEVPTAHRICTILVRPCLLRVIRVFIIPYLYYWNFIEIALIYTALLEFSSQMFTLLV